MRPAPADADLPSARSIADSTTPGNQPPVAAGPYRPVVRAGEWIICSGQLGVQAGELVEGVGAQFRQAVANLESLLASEGASLADVMKTTVFLTDMADFDEMNGIYLEFFSEPRPARSAVAVVALPRAARIEIEAWAFSPS
jgi:2-iminobutanoate/2-iminopropanoate deaminase